MNSVEELLSQLGTLGIRLTMDGEHLRLSAPKGALTPDLREKVIQHKAAIVVFLRDVGLSSGSDSLTIRPVPRDSAFPLSFAQQRLWFLDQLEPNSSAYNAPAAYRLAGPLDVMALEAAINEIVRRHEALRTTFASVDGEPVQVIAPTLCVPLRMTDLEVLPRAEREPEAWRRAVADAYSSFDLSRGPLLRAQLLRLGEEEHILVLTLHHIVTDGWSVGVFRRELAELYAAFSAGRPSPLPELVVQYADFAVWQRKWLKRGVLARELGYWRERLEGASELELPSDRPRPALLTYEGARLAMSFSAELTSALKVLSQQEGVTLFMTLLAAFNTLLYRYTGQEDIVVGTPIANRDRAEVEGLIGFFVNTLVIRTGLTGTLTFREVLGRVRETCLEAYAHQHLPFEKLVEELQLQRDLSRNPLFQVVFAMQNAPRPTMEMAGLRVTPLDLPGIRVRFDLECSMWEEGEAIRGALVYNTNLFDGATIERLAGHFQTLLEGVVANPGQRISDLPLLTERERHQLLVEWNRTEAAYPRDVSIHELFEAQVERAPDAAAVSFEGQELTYDELNRKANQLARYLRKLGVGPEVLVGLCVERSLEMMIGVLGILKAGAAYVPLDPTYPKKRLALMMADAQVPVLLTQDRLLPELPAHMARAICLDADWATIDREKTENPVNKVTADNLAYVIFTSGSTGAPKGVMITHRGVCNCLLWMQADFAFDKADIVLQKAPISFDGSVWELFVPLFAGAQLAIARPWGHQDPAYLITSVIQLHATVLQGVPTLLQMLLAEADLGACHSLRSIFSGGEALTTEVAERIVACLPGVRLHNLYGPTEVSLTASSWTYQRNTEADTVPIGRPISNTQVYILDSSLQVVPIGIAGELYVSGIGLARGYLNRPGHTAECFIPNPFSNQPGARLYRTGDVARYLPDGSIEFLGRSDDQVKIRGFRIELGEIEAVLEKHRAVRKAVAWVREGASRDASAVPDTDRRLVAYVVPKETPGPRVSELRSYLQDRLPEYMWPSAYVLLDALPLTPSGKIDHRSLPAPDPTRPELDKVFVAPRTPVEIKLAEIWAQVLGLERVGIDDDFFELGGHSLLATQVISRVRDAFHIEIPLRSLFERPTVAALAERIEVLCALTEVPQDRPEARTIGRL